MASLRQGHGTTVGRRKSLTAAEKDHTLTDRGCAFKTSWAECRDQKRCRHRANGGDFSLDIHSYRTILRCAILLFFSSISSPPWPGCAHLENKLLDFRTYFNNHRTHSSREGRTPDMQASRPIANLRSFRAATTLAGPLSDPNGSRLFKDSRPPRYPINLCKSLESNHPVLHS